MFCILNVYGQFVPETRVGHTTVYVDSQKRIYYIGGFNYNKSAPTEPDPISDFFFLNVNGSDMNFLTFTNLSSEVNLPLTVWHQSELGGVNQDSIFILGGVHWSDAETNYVYSFDINTNQLSIPAVQGKSPPMRKGISSVINEGKIYLFGGQTGNGRDAVYFNNFDIFDTINLNWQVGSLVNSPGTRVLYTATLVNGIIYYIGGRIQYNVYSPLSEIYQYDIAKNIWSLKQATAVDLDSMPGSRVGHSAVLLNGKIIIYGGFYTSADTPYNIPAKETIAMLDVNTLVWSLPTFDVRKHNEIPNLAYHTATLVGTVMIISFGNFTDIPTNIDQTNKVVYTFFIGDQLITSDYLSVFDKQYSTNKTNPQLPTTSSNNINPQQPPSSSKVIIVGVAIGSVSAALAIFAGLSMIYKRSKRSQVPSGSVHNDPNSSNGVQFNNDKYPTPQLASQQLQHQRIQDPEFP
ncbi:hypothetical protein RclHR1_00600026 [Rhizophagus clarus]|nr:hypothetical protein RclHR1_00600026 [Rhizophagus clarus]